MAINFKILSDSINSILFLKKYHIIESIVKQKIKLIKKYLENIYILIKLV